MITSEQAREIADRFIAEANARPRYGDDELVITGFAEHRFGWSFSYQSSRWVETGDIQHLLIGQGPVVIDRRDGSVHAFGSATPDADVARFQERYDAETKNL
ncbi:YrhB domain-containing protein [Streptacidiphilus fuscans]|uniref:Immunity protein 35 domain-containing protein n=1 Tax=Streptacidiphilus fuscans TaxID=2789292 RepID=A0A931B5V4_9ACTN|nr:YrhB domain-containing protein [Streptacidiphilus fuscans]MBF9069207.1 hypothetical protein [Streptacidiphilus fuscans]